MSVTKWIPSGFRSSDNIASSSESGHVAFASFPQKKSSWSIDSIRVPRKKIRSRVVEAAQASGIESGGVAATSTRAHDFLQVRGVQYRPPGTAINLLNDVSLSLSEKSLGLVYGRSGSGKTTLLQVLAGLAAPTGGSITLATL